MTSNMDFANVNIEVILTGVVGIITTIVSGWTSWFFCKKKYNAEVDNNIILNMQKSLEFYTKLSDDTRERLEESLREKAKLEDEVSELRREMLKFMSNVCYNMSCELRKLEHKNNQYGIKKTKQGRRSNETSETSLS